MAMRGRRLAPRATSDDERGTFRRETSKFDCAPITGLKTPVITGKKTPFTGTVGASSFPSEWVE